MNLYLISQDVNDNYDTYDSAVVVAKDEESARRISPSPYYIWHEDGGWHFICHDGERPNRTHFTWTTPENVRVTYIGKAESHLEKGSVVCASFRAG